MLPPTSVGIFDVFNMCATSAVGRRFSVRPGNRHQLPAQESPGQLDFAPYRNVFLARGFERRQIRRHSRTHHNQILLQKARIHMPAEFEPHAGGAQLLRASPKVSASGRSSVAVTVAPYPALNNAVTSPVLARPTTRTRLPAKSNPGLNSSSPGFHLARTRPSPQFQCRQRKKREHQRHNPEPHDNFRLAPAQQFKMMMQRRHAEHALPGQLE